MAEDVIYEKSDGIARITLNRPQAMNALDDSLNAALDGIWQDFAADASLDVAILSGAGRAFCAGADLKTWIPKWEHANLWDLRRNAAFGIAGGITRGQHRLAKPVIAAIGGGAYGGGFELALACDIRLASDTARFGVFEVRQGIHQGDGGLARLVAIAGIGVALDLTLTGREIDAAEAHRLRLVSAVVAPQELAATALDWAQRIRSNGQRAVRSAKETVLDLIGRPLDDALRLEAINAYSCIGDFTEVGRRLAQFRQPRSEGKSE
ncbi:enoyl-CoA hydratase-related protein [Accumulibacter sp.]|uniref:enoyl-CoA hydratase/isomerase family protein n=1 Tax=Accumulibacter sp. TaxID=2053492 RepID=UPI0026398B94|nr:enoyl-CoA hydratase-related protein [Accumulibacter sp.]